MSGQLHSKTIPPEHTAWGILLVAFGVFCFICAAISIGMYYFFFESPLPLQTTLYVGRNTSRIVEQNKAEQAVIDRRAVFTRTFVHTDPTDLRSQSVLHFYDPAIDQPVVTITMKSGTDLFLQRANRPRFNWSNTIYWVEVSDLVGQAEITVHPRLPREFRIILSTIHNVDVHIHTGGTYLIEVTPNKVQVTNRQGSAIVVEPVQNLGSLVPEGFTEIYDVETRKLSRHPNLVNLVVNSELEVETNGDHIMIAAWQCRNGPVDRLPYGDFREEIIPQGDSALRLMRGNNADNSGFTLCEQSFGEDEFGLDVSQHDYLEIEATLYVNYQSLNRCGTLATECPLMLRLTYWSNGSENDWYHGIYAHNDAEVDYPLRCPSCWENHLLINEKLSYTYESGNLFEIIPFEILHPDAVTSLSFYASGHQYDVYVQDIALYAGNLAES